MPGYDLMVQAISGLMSLTGDADGPPFRAGISVFDVMAGKDAVIGILAALRHRDATGEGQEVEVNLLSSALSGLVNHSSAWVAGGVVPFRMGNAHPSVYPYEPMPTADRDLIVAAPNDRLFRKLCVVLGIPEVPDDPRFARNSDRTANRAELRPLLVERLATRGAEEWFELLVGAGVPCGPINTIDGGLRDGGEVRAGAGHRGGRGRARAADGPQPDHVLGHADRLRAAATRAGRARRRAAEVAGVVSDQPLSYETALGASTRETITLLGHDLARDVMGEVGFGELAFWLATQERPTKGQTRVFEAVLAALADHGFTPTAIATRLTCLSAPDSVQGALAAGLLGGGSRFLGVTEDTGRFLHAALPDAAAAGRRRLGRAGPGDDPRAPGRRRVRAGPGPPRPQGRRPAHAAADADRRATRAASVRTCGCSRRSAGSTRRCWAARSR